MRIVYFCLGYTPDLLVQLETSILRCASLMPEGSTIHLYCEDSKPYENWPVQIEKRTLKQFEQWKGAHHFFWRIKINLILEMVQNYPTDKILYLDADTLAVDLAKVDKQLERINLMHLNEGTLSELTTKTERRMCQQITGRQAHGIEFQDGMEMFNAGVVGLMPGQTESMTLALSLCDTWLDWEVTPRLIEQLALSVALNTSRDLGTCSELIGHYWSTKDWWVPFLKQWLDTHHGRTIEEKITAIKELDTAAYPFWAKRSNTARRLRKLFGRK